MKLPLSYPTLIPRSNSLEALRQLFNDLSRALQQIAIANNNPDSGAATLRPTQQLTVGQVYFDSTLGKPIWWKGTAWIDATGATV
jgi:hypothetical protein